MHLDRHGKMVCIFGNQTAQPPFVQKLICVAAQMQGYFGAPLGFGDGFHLKLGFTGGNPANAPGCLAAGFSGFYGYLVRNNKCGVKTNAKLANQKGIFLFITGQGFQKMGRAGFGNGAEVFNHFLAAHAYAVVCDGKGAGRRVQVHKNRKVGLAAEQALIRQHSKTQPVHCIRGIGYELPDEHLPIRVKRVNHEVQQLLCLRLKTQLYPVLPVCFC